MGLFSYIGEKIKELYSNPISKGLVLVGAAALPGCLEGESSPSNPVIPPDYVKRATGAPLSPKGDQFNLKIYGPRQVHADEARECVITLGEGANRQLYLGSCIAGGRNRKMDFAGEPEIFSGRPTPRGEATNWREGGEAISPFEYLIRGMDEFKPILELVEDIGGVLDEQERERLKSGLPVWLRESDIELSPMMVVHGLQSGATAGMFKVRVSAREDCELYVRGKVKLVDGDRVFELMDTFYIDVAEDDSQPTPQTVRSDGNDVQLAPINPDDYVGRPKRQMRDVEKPESSSRRQEERNEQANHWTNLMNLQEYRILEVIDESPDVSILKQKLCWTGNIEDHVRMGWESELIYSPRERIEAAKVLKERVQNAVIESSGDEDEDERRMVVAEEFSRSEVRKIDETIERYRLEPESMFERMQQKDPRISDVDIVFAESNFDQRGNAIRICHIFVRRDDTWEEYGKIHYSVNNGNGWMPFKY